MTKLIFKWVLHKVEKWALETPNLIDNELISLLKTYIKEW